MLLWFEVGAPGASVRLSFFVEVSMRFRIKLIMFALLLSRKSPAQQVFDSHVHLWESEKSLQEYERQAKAKKIDIIGFGGMWFGGPNQALSGHPNEIRASNDAQLALAKKHPEMLPIATVHPYDETASEEVKRVAALGFTVLKLHPHTQKFDPADPRVLTVVTLAGKLGMIVLMDNFNIIPGDSEKLFNLALTTPGTRFIFAHLGGMNFRFWNVIRAARTAKGLYADNIYFDISGTTVLLKDSPIRKEFVWTIRGVGIDHVLLGSDYPQFTLAETLSAFERLDLTGKEKRKILIQNARSLFQLNTLTSAKVGNPNKAPDR
jgi:predicted TIM-barrel fold metal-dependent hydrolase